MLTWHQEIPKRTGRPILQLRLLGRFDEEMSCANSRFFRTTLYPDAAVTRLLAERFVLCWHSVRPVPKVTIDFGDGRKLERTLTGNSAHLVLDARGRPVDALPGLYDAERFVRLAAAAADLAETTCALDGERRLARLADWHRARKQTLERAWRKEVSAEITPEEANDELWQLLALSFTRGALPSDRSEILRRFPSAREAGEIAKTKMMVERPLLNALEPLARSIAEDGTRNEFKLHRRVHDRFVARRVGDSPDALSAWIYRDLFLMPEEDPWLGLRPDVYAGLAE
jgi:hypothetical protein